MDNVYLASGGARLEVDKQRAEEAESIRKNMLQRRQLGIQEEELGMRREDNTLNRLNTQMDLRLKQNAIQKEEYENSLLRNMQSAESPVQNQEVQAQDYEKLAQTNTQLGMQMNKVDPIKAKKYFDNAEGYRSAAANGIKTALEIKSKQVDQAGQILANISNQNDLNSSLADLASAGLVVPPEYRDWKNPKTRDWITKTALRSPTIAKDLQDQVGFLAETDALAVDKLKNEVIDAKKYDLSLRERASQAAPLAKTGGKQSAINERFNDRVINAGRQAAAAINNISQMPLEKTSYGGYKTDKSGIMDATVDALVNKLTPADNQAYDIMMTGVGRQLATLETFGLAPPVSFAESFKTLTSKPNDTVKARLLKLAEMRQIVETSLGGFLDKPSIPESQKEAIREMIANTEKAVPFSVEDIVQLENSKVGNDYTLGNLIRKKGVKGIEEGSAKSERASQFKVLR